MDLYACTPVRYCAWSIHSMVDAGNTRGTSSSFKDQSAPEDVIGVDYDCCSGNDPCWLSKVVENVTIDEGRYKLWEESNRGRREKGENWLILTE